MSPLQEKLYHTPLDFSAVTVESIQQNLADIKQLYLETYDQIASLLATPEQIDFSTTAQQLIDLNICIEKARELCVFPKEVHIDAAIRTAAADAETELNDFAIKCDHRDDVFKVFQCYEEGAYQAEAPLLSTEHNNYFKELMLDYRRNGLYLEDSQLKARVTDINQQISALTIEFCKNVENENTYFIIPKVELDGLPDDWFNKEREVSPGMYKATLKYPDYFPILDFASNREVRKKLFTAFYQRCEAENIPILKTILTLRSELAQLLGYKTYADYVAEERMAGNAKTVQTFLDQMNERFTPLLDSNLKALTQFAREKEHDDTLELQLFDMRYYTRAREEEICKINMQEIQQYFPQEKVINGTFEIYEKILGLKFIKRENPTSWHPDVSYFDVYNDDFVSDSPGEKISGFYLDLYPREGKFAHAEAVSLQTSCELSQLSGIPNDRHLNLSAMVCNFPKNENLPFDDVVTFFHEFGHIMHFTCSKALLKKNHANSTETDFVEAPSQMLENWCYDPRVLTYLSEHSQTKQALPQEIALQLKHQKNMHAGYFNKRQLTFAIFDLNVHSMSTQELEQLDLKTYYNQLQAKITQLPIVKESCLPSSFEHIVSEYDAGYYGYLWSETYAADMYASAFQLDPLSPESGQRYRQCILSPGSSKGGMEMLHDFLGRAPTIDAFLAGYGLSDKITAPARHGLGLFDKLVVTKNLPVEQPNIEFVERIPSPSYT